MLEPLIGGVLNLKLIEQQFEEIVRLVTSIRHAPAADRVWHDRQNL